ncbi:Mrp-type sodium/proton antiporter system subunit E [Natronomonas pharaonis DSM 2160]|uniref:Mrp-type sodium/proton antiporter system subunit E n=1 Tax=Natronomonas pharaonis (strain ATCC 35678 / DSM 2160 / CIP 103997 / JCM 8858 / NBRC 14720 / NCIMB 2260 / Gabara) TaxID=348780 RepID=Q3ITM1_NATPD|nr:monovalent cation/H+ antiporter subunit E [Natronomonas pharaonis]CAI48512.1 Mrp-type sodium/proton antiporter system subunit E [Natronomonas pharaonis DSM 2160]
MEDAIMSVANDVLVPISPSTTLKQTINYAVEVANGAESGGSVHLVLTTPGHHVGGEGLNRDKELLARVEGYAAAAAEGSVSIEAKLLGTDEYFADPEDHFELLVRYVEEHGIERVVIDRSYSVDATAQPLQDIGAALAEAGIDYEVPAASGSWRPTGAELVRGSIIAVVAFGFYIALGGPTYTFALWTGAVTALIAAVLLRNVAFERTPQLGAALATVGRGLLFIPYMLWEITKANVQFAYVVLHPSLPIDPCLDRVDAAVGDGLSLTTFANSITLTPGTLTVDSVGNELLVHSLAPSAREDLINGLHERAVRFFFYGRKGLELPGPAARGDVEPLIRPSETKAEAITDGGTDEGGDADD